MDLLRKLFKPKSVAAITASLQTMMGQLQAHETAKAGEIGELVEKMNELQQQRLNAEAEKQLAGVVYNNLAAIFNNPHVDVTKSWKPS